METFKTKLLNTNEEVKIHSNTAMIPIYFIRVSKEILIGTGENSIKSWYFNDETANPYIYQLKDSGIYEYVANINIRPLETELLEKPNEKILQLQVYAGLTGFNQKEQFALMCERSNEEGFMFRPEEFRYVFGGKSKH